MPELSKERRAEYREATKRADGIGIPAPDLAALLDMADERDRLREQVAESMELLRQTANMMAVLGEHYGDRKTKRETNRLFDKFSKLCAEVSHA